MNSTILRAVLALTDQALVSLNSFITIVLVARFGTNDDINLYALAWSLLNIARVIQERTVSAPYVVFAYQKNRDATTFLGSSLLHQAGLGTFLGMIFLIVGLILRSYQQSAGWGPPGLGTCLLAIAISLPFQLLRDHLRIVSSTHFRYTEAVTINATALGLQLLMMFAAHRLGWFNTVNVFLLMGLSSLIPCVVWYVYNKSKYQLHLDTAWEDWRTTFRYSKWLVAARVFPTVAGGALPWIVYWVVNPDASGVLATCLTLANISLMLISGSNNFFQPRTVAAYHDFGLSAMLNTLAQSALLFCVGLGGLTIVFWLLGDWLLGAIFGSEFIGYGSVVGLLGLHLLIVSFSTVAGNGMAALGRPEGLFWGEIGYAIVVIVAGTMLSRTLGLNGTAAAMCLAALASTLIAAGSLFWICRSLATPQVETAKAYDLSELGEQGS